MSLVFSDTTGNAGIVQLLDQTLKTDSVSYPIADKVRDVNLAQNRARFLIREAAGSWQDDDPNHTKLPIITMDLVSGQRDYSFLRDQEGALIEDFFKVLVADQNYHFNEITLRDVASESEGSPPGNISNFTNGVDATGVPNQYDKMGNTIFLDPIPNYSWRIGTELKQGIKIYVNRDDTYFIATDTSKLPGLAGLFHEYLVLRPAQRYAERNGMDIATILRLDVAEMEHAITSYYASRERAGRNKLTASPINPF